MNQTTIPGSPVALAVADITKTAENLAKLAEEMSVRVSSILTPTPLVNDPPCDPEMPGSVGVKSDPLCTLACDLNGIERRLGKVAEKLTQTINGVQL